MAKNCNKWENRAKFTTKLRKTCRECRKMHWMGKSTKIDHKIAKNSERMAKNCNKWENRPKFTIKLRKPGKKMANKLQQRGKLTKKFLVVLILGLGKLANFHKTQLNFKSGNRFNWKLRKASVSFRFWFLVKCRSFLIRKTKEIGQASRKTHTALPLAPYQNNIGSGSKKTRQH